MYGKVTTYLPIEMSSILAVTSEETVFKLVVEDVVLDKKKLYRAPYRNDHSPKCYFEVGRNGRLHFVDFADPTRIRKDCFGLIEAYYGLSKVEALHYIDQQLGLGISNGDKVIVKKVEIPETIKHRSEYREKRIEYSRRPFDLRDRGFWYAQYGITREELKGDGVFPISYYRFETKDGAICDIRPMDICYIYTEFANNKMKIYRPTGSSTEKWLTNCSKNDIGGVKHIDYTKDYLVITKSYKDYRVLRNAGVNTVWFQNEGMIPDKEVLEHYKLLSFGKVYIWFDNDSTGLSAGIKVKETLLSYNVKLSLTSIIIPIPLRTEHGVKDPADYRKYNQEEFHKFIHTKIFSHGKIHS